MIFSLRVRFLVDDGGRFHVGGSPGVEFVDYFVNQGMSCEDAYRLYANAYRNPPTIHVLEAETASTLLDAAERSVGIDPANRFRNRGLCGLVLGIGDDLYRLTDSGMELKVLLKYFEPDQIHAAYLLLKNTAGEVRLGVKGLRFFIHPSERCGHNEPHVHVSTPDRRRESVLRVPDGMRLEHGGPGLPKQLMSRARDAVVANGVPLMDEWLRQVDGIVRITDGSLGPAEIIDDGMPVLPQG